MKRKKETARMAIAPEIRTVNIARGSFIAFSHFFLTSTVESRMRCNMSFRSESATKARSTEVQILITDKKNAGSKSSIQM